MCEFCMRHAGNGQECGKDYTIHPCANGDLGVRAEYIDGGMFMYIPDGGLVALAARDYYYQNYANEEERKSMDREDKIQTAVAIIFMIVFWVAVGFAIMSSFLNK